MKRRKKMKSVMKITIVLGATLVLLGVVASCEQKGRSEEKSGKVGKSEEEFVGKYVNQDDPQRYVELKSDYTLYIKEKFLLGDYYEMKGKWETGSDEVLLVGPLGGVNRCKIKGNTLIDGDGKIWTKQGETRNITKETSSEDKTSGDADRIPGRYIVEEIKKDGTTEKGPGVMIFKRDGRLTDSSSGSEKLKWELKNGAVHIYQYFSDGGWDEVLSESEFGKLRGSTIIFKIKDDEQVDEVRYIKQNGHSPPISSTDKTSGDADRIPGRYIVEEIKKDGTAKKAPGIAIFREDGRMVLIYSGSEFVVPDLKWKFQNGVVSFCSDDESEPLEGKIEGNALIFKMGDSELRYIREDGRPFSLTSSANPPAPKSCPQYKEETKPKSVYALWEEDDKKLRAEPATELKFKKLSMEDEIQAQRLWEWIITQRKMARLPAMVGYKQMVDTCREIIRRWPESEYAFKAKRALIDLPEQHRKQYNITDEEINL
jgi:hypothetical protein